MLFFIVTGDAIKYGNILSHVMDISATSHRNVARSKATGQCCLKNRTNSILGDFAANTVISENLSPTEPSFCNNGIANLGNLL